jgi:23S rRNA (cytosine1962-C5)-methyltransferase
VASRALLPIAQVTARGAARLRKLNPWCYRTELLAAPPPVEPGAVVEVRDPQGNPIGQAFYAHRSPIALRLLTRKGPSEEPVDEAFFQRRLLAAVARRAALAGRDGLRLVHGEADLLPGLVVDRYGAGLVLQTLSEGADARKGAFAAALAELTSAQCVVCRDDASGRDFEGLPREAKVLWGEGPTKVAFHEGARRFEVDLLEDMKTGSFLDQVENHLRAGELAFGEALDCFCYHGGFALALAARCQTVLAVEQDDRAAARAAHNAQQNGLGNVQVQRANAFDVLHAFDKEGRRFDTLVLDPPALAKRKEGVRTALRAYKELNLRALRCLRPEGLMITCSCSGKLDRAAFEQMVLSAAEDARRSVQILERRGAGLDHPVLASLPETDYLKVLILRVL